MKPFPVSAHGASWMFFSVFCYVSSVTLLRLLVDTYSPFLLVFFRSVIAIIILAPFFLRSGNLSLWPDKVFTHILNGAFMYLAIFLWFFAAARMPVAEFFALQFATPLFTIAFAIMFLREKSDWASWLATLTGFFGVLIVLRPGILSVSMASIAAIGCAGSYASVNTVIKNLSKTFSTVVIVFYANLLLIVISLPMAIMEWHTPSIEDVPTIIGISVLSTFGYSAVTKAIGLAPARVVQPVNFLRMPVGAAFGWVLFSEFPDIWTWIGAVIIFCAATYVVQRGSRKTE